MRYGTPDIFNTDQASKFQSQAFTGVLIEAGIAISMDGKGAWRDNVFVERLWRSVKYDEIYVKAYDTVGKARASIGQYLTLYNGPDRIPALTGRHRTKPISAGPTQLQTKRCSDKRSHLNLPDGTGRLGRFIMNAMLASGGLP